LPQLPDPGDPSQVVKSALGGIKEAIAAGREIKETAKEVNTFLDEEARARVAWRRRQQEVQRRGDMMYIDAINEYRILFDIRRQKEQAFKQIEKEFGKRERSNYLRNPKNNKGLVMEKTAKELASKVIGVIGIPAIVLMVGMVIYSAMQLSSEALTPIVGMASGVIMALISMIGGITGTKDKEEKPEFQVIQNLIARLDQKEPPMRVDVEDGKVTVRKGDDTVSMGDAK